MKVVVHPKVAVSAILGGGYHKDLTECIFAFINGINQKDYTQSKRKEGVNEAEN